MSSIGNKEVMAKNLQHHLKRTGKMQKEVAEVIGVSTSIFSDWVKGRKYPRIDKIELLANYFGILKSDLIEDKGEQYNSMKQKNDVISDIVIKLRMDNEFLSIVERLYNLDAEKLNGIKSLLTAFSISEK